MEVFSASSAFLFSLTESGCFLFLLPFSQNRAAPPPSSFITTCRFLRHRFPFPPIPDSEHPEVVCYAVHPMFPCRPRFSRIPIVQRNACTQPQTPLVLTAVSMLSQPVHLGARSYERVRGSRDLRETGSKETACSVWCRPSVSRLLAGFPSHNHIGGLRVYRTLSYRPLGRAMQWGCRTRPPDNG